MFDDAMTAFLEGGCALLVGTVDPDGAPHASRAWGLRVVAGGPRVRLLVAAEDHATRANLDDGGRVAITATDVPTLYSVQLKGRALGVEPTTEEDEAQAERFRELFYADIVETDGTPRQLLERLTPVGHLTCIVEVEEVFDQTPGPRAGTAISSSEGSAGAAGAG